MSVPLPAFFGKYQLLSHIAEGGMADVYLSRLSGPGGFEKRLVVKVIRPELAARREFCELFVAEAKVTVSLTHANIVPVYELGMVEGQYFLAMELVDGPPLHQLLFDERPGRNGPLPGPISAYIAEQILRGLDYAHRCGVVHRDLSSANVICSREGEVKIVDFGIAAHFPGWGRPGKEQVHMTGGSLGYMPPEQERGEAPDARGDLYAVGVLLGEMLTGKRFSNAEQLLADEACVPRELAEVVAKATQKEPEARFQDAAEMLLMISRYLRQVDPPTQTELSKLVRRRAPDERRLGIGSLPRILTRGGSTKRPLTTPTAGPVEDTPMPLTRPLSRKSRRHDETELAPITRPDLPLTPRTETLPHKTPLGPLAAISQPLPVTTEGEAEHAAPPPTPKSKLQPPIATAGTVTFASRRAQVLPTWRTYLFVAMALSALAGFGLLWKMRADRAWKAAPPPTTSVLMLQVPQGATLLIDGLVTASGTPTTVAPGRHQIEARAPGRRPVFLNVSVQAGETYRERLSLPWAVGHLQVQSDPQGADVSLNGEEMGQAPVHLDVPLDRKVLVRIQKKGYLPAQREIHPAQWPAQLPAQSTAQLTALPDQPPADVTQPEMRMAVTLEALANGQVTVGAIPWAQVYIDGEYRGDTPLSRIVLSSGPHLLRVYCPSPGCNPPKETKQTVTIEPGQRLHRVFDFQKQ